MAGRPNIADSEAARRFSAIAVCEALGVPPRDRSVFAQWAVGPLAPGALDALYQYIDVLIAERCRKPADDLLSDLIAMEVDGVELTVDDIRRYVATLIVHPTPDHHAAS